MKDKEKIKAEVEKCISNYKYMLDKFDKTQDGWVDTVSMLEAKVDVLEHIIYYIDSLPEDSVSEDLEEEVDEYILNNFDDAEGRVYVLQCARHFANWQKQRTINKACEWLEDNLSEYCAGEYIEFSATHIDNIDILSQEELIRDLRKAMEDEK